MRFLTGDETAGYEQHLAEAVVVGDGLALTEDADGRPVMSASGGITDVLELGRITPLVINTSSVGGNLNFDGDETIMSDVLFQLGDGLYAFKPGNPNGSGIGLTVKSSTACWIDVTWCVSLSGAALATSTTFLQLSTNEGWPYVQDYFWSEGRTSFTYSLHTVLELGSPDFQFGWGDDQIITLFSIDTITPSAPITIDPWMRVIKWGV